MNKKQYRVVKQIIKLEESKLNIDKLGNSLYENVEYILQVINDSVLIKRFKKQYYAKYLFGLMNNGYITIKDLGNGNFSLGISNKIYDMYFDYKEKSRRDLLYFISIIALTITGVASIIDVITKLI